MLQFLNVPVMLMMNDQTYGNCCLEKKNYTELLNTYIVPFESYLNLLFVVGLLIDGNMKTYYLFSMHNIISIA